MSIKMMLAAVGTAALLFTGVAPAQAAAEKPTAAAKAKPQRTAKSLECSKKADEQNLHGKPRRKFMSTCKKA